MPVLLCGLATINCGSGANDCIQQVRLINYSGFLLGFLNIALCSDGTVPPTLATFRRFDCFYQRPLLCIARASGVVFLHASINFGRALSDNIGGGGRLSCRCSC